MTPTLWMLAFAFVAGGCAFLAEYSSQMKKASA